MSFYNISILKQAAKTSFIHVSLLVALIGIPIVFFRDGLSFVEQLILFIGLLVFFWLAYFLLCIAFHRYNLRDEDNRIAYLEKNDIEKGKEVGSLLEGW
ncbi:hypothetical protein [Glaciecola sp. 1036]|uniref:hypothetical protein n=1 Tax=Alteromonadaceae TaxID=72275 RepID=UPI003D04EBCB